MEISEVTRRNILDELFLSGESWNGRLSEVDFLKRIFHLQEMPSNDSRYPNMAGDIYQHRINNLDWEDDWIIEDSRINLLQSDDKIFLDFLCETIHPIVRISTQETEKLLKIYNVYLEKDGYELYEIRKISGRSVFNARLITIPVKFENVNRVNSEFVKKQIEKCNSKLKEADFDGAITNARSLVEGILGEIYHKCTGEFLEATGDLLKDYKKVKDLLNLSEEQYSHESIKSIIRSFNGIIQNIDTLSNRMGDRHRPIIKPAKHHAKLVVDSAISISDFLFSSMEYQSNRKNSFLSRLLEILDSDKRFFSGQQLLEDEDIKELISTSEIYLRQLVKEEFINHFKVDSYRQNDIYFAVMRIFLEELSVEDIVAIYIESKTNDQLIGWGEFEKELSEQKPLLLKSTYGKINSV